MFDYIGQRLKESRCNLCGIHTVCFTWLGDRTESICEACLHTALEMFRPSGEGVYDFEKTPIPAPAEIRDGMGNVHLRVLWIDTITGRCCKHALHKGKPLFADGRLQRVYLSLPLPITITTKTITTKTSIDTSQEGVLIEATARFGPLLDDDLQRTK